MPRILSTLLLALALLLSVAPHVGAEPIHVNARGHVQNVGWLPWVADSQTVGTTAERTLTVHNTGTAPLTVRFESEVPHLTWTAIPSTMRSRPGVLLASARRTS